MQEQKAPRHESQPYTRPLVQTLEVRQLVEAVGPAQALSSGLDAAAPLGKSTLRSGGLRRSRGSRG